jgi:hypothetical protein
MLIARFLKVIFALLSASETSFSLQKRAGKIPNIKHVNPTKTDKVRTPSCCVLNKSTLAIWFFLLNLKSFHNQNQLKVLKI